MYGALYVVDDLDEYLADPEGYLVKHPLPAVDELLKTNRPRKEWKFEDLAPAVESLAGRSFANGRQMFQVANCVACHKLNGVGTEIGQDLTKLDPKTNILDVPIPASVYTLATITDFQTTVQKPYKSGGKKLNYVSAKCSKKSWTLKGVFIYTSDPTDNPTVTQSCKQK